MSKRVGKFQLNIIRAIVKELSDSCKKSLNEIIKPSSNNKNEQNSVNILSNLIKADINLVTALNILNVIASKQSLIHLVADRAQGIPYIIIFILKCMIICAYDDKVSKRNRSIIISFIKICDVLLLHTDCPPIYPYNVKPLIQCIFKFCKKNSIKSQPTVRFYQACLTMDKSLFDNNFLLKAKQNMKNEISLNIEKKLWNLVSELFIEYPQEITIKAIENNQRPTKVHNKIEALLVGFERLNFLSNMLFNNSLILFGSAVNGFATNLSDIDVVIKLDQSKIDTIFNDILEAKAKGFLDINPFPAKAMNLSNTIHYQPLIGDWSWINENDKNKTVAIWTNRIFAWAVYRIYGWSVECIQKSYIPIVKIVGAIDSETASPISLPPYHFLQSQGILTITSNQTSNCSKKKPEHDKNLLTNMYILTMNLLNAQNKLDPFHLLNFESLLTLFGSEYNESLQNIVHTPYANLKIFDEIAYMILLEIACENMYSKWKPALILNLITVEECISAMKDKLSPDIVRKAIAIFKAYWNNEVVICQKLGLIRYIPMGRVTAALGYAQLDESINQDYVCYNVNPDLYFYYFNNISEYNIINNEVWIVEADFSFGKQMGIHNSRLLRSYAYIDPRIQALVILIKHWARCNNIANSYMGYFSGYHWTILVLHFLQHYYCLKVDYEAPSMTNSTRKVTKTMHTALIPNLQCSYYASQHYKNCVAKENNINNINEIEPLYVDEPDGPNNCAFYCPINGLNKDLNDPTSTWPENVLLNQSAFKYVLHMLTPPYNLTSAASISKAIKNNKYYTNKIVCKSCNETRYETLTKMRLETTKAQQPCTKKILDSDIVNWIINEYNLSDELIKNQSMTSKCTDLKSIKGLDTFLSHFSLNDIFPAPADNQTILLFNLLIGFFIYFTAKFNPYAEIVDIACTTIYPSSKKEVFHTSMIDPFEPANKSVKNTKENAGRGVDAYNYKARHHLSLIDPFERDRTIGLFFKCQTIISKYFLQSLLSLFEIKCHSSSEQQWKVLKSIFTLSTNKYSQANKSSLIVGAEAPCLKWELNWSNQSGVPDLASLYNTLEIYNTLTNNNSNAQIDSYNHNNNKQHKDFTNSVDVKSLDSTRKSNNKITDYIEQVKPVPNEYSKNNINNDNNGYTDKNNGQTERNDNNMKIILKKLSTFCGSVQKAKNIIYKLDKDPKLNCIYNKKYETAIYKVISQSNFNA